MDNIKKTVVKYGALTMAFLASATPAFAQATYSMDATVQASATDLLESLVAVVYTIIPVAIGIVGGLVVTLYGLRWLIGFARKNMHG